MALSQAQLQAANELFKRGLNVDGKPLSDGQKQAVSGLIAKGVDPAQTLLGGQQQPQAGALARFGAGAATPALSGLQNLRQRLSPLGQINPAFAAKPLVSAESLRRRLPKPTGVAGTLGQIAGIIPLASEVGGGGLETLGGRVASRGLTGSALGSSISPKSPILGATIGGATSVAAGAIPSIVRGLFGSNAASKLTKKALDEISGGLHSARPATSLEDNAQAAAAQIRDLHTDLVKNYEGQINDVMNKHENTLINTPEFGKFSGTVTKLAKRSTKDAMGKFESEPNLVNAHNLQSTLGKNIRDVTRKANLSLQDINNLDDLNAARDSLKTDIGTSLDKADTSGESSTNYKAASDFFKKHVVPFDSKPGLKDIAKGTITNPGNLTTIFKRPEESISGNPEDEVKGILDKLPPAFKNKIAYDTLGRNQKTIDPKRFIRAVDSMDSKGLAKHYLPEDIENARDVIEQSAAHKEGVVPKIIKGGLIRIPEWLIAGTALKFGIPAITGRENTGL